MAYVAVKGGERAGEGNTAVAHDAHAAAGDHALAVRYRDELLAERNRGKRDGDGCVVAVLPRRWHVAERRHCDERAVEFARDLRRVNGSPGGVGVTVDLKFQHHAHAPSWAETARLVYLGATSAR